MDSGMEILVSAWKSLKARVERSKALGLSLEKAGLRLEEINQRLPYLEAAIQPIRAQRDDLRAVGGHINRALVPATAVLKVFDAIHCLEKSLPSPQSDLLGYLGVLKRLKEALRFLGENCGMAIQWLADIVEYLEDHKMADERFISSFRKALESLWELEGGKEKGILDGGLLQVSLDRLANEFQRLLSENSVPYPMASPILENEQTCIAPSPLPVAVIHKLQAILGTFISNDRLDSCMSIYIEVRSSNARASLQELKLDYLEISPSEFNNVASIEVYIARWGRHLEFAVKHLFESEYKLCNDVFEAMGFGVWKSCFAKIASQAGLLAFLQFGKMVTESKKDPVKLLKLLDILSSLYKLRLDFNRLFDGVACAEIQKLTRDLIRRVIQGAYEIFWELSVQVELQKYTPAPSDCSVPRVVTFITDYCNKLLVDEYKPILTHVLVREQTWKNEKFRERILINELLNLIKAIELNLESWSDGYKTAASSYLFLMNNHWHIHKYLRGTKLGGILGDSWLSKHKEYKEYYLAMFLRESWGKLPALLSREGLIMFSGSHATARNLVKQRLKSFNEAFDEMHKRNSDLVIEDKHLRNKTCHIIIQTIVPVYRSYMQNYGPLMDQDQSASKFAKYTAQSLEKVLGSLFHHKPMKHGRSKMRQLSAKLNNEVVDQYPIRTPHRAIE